MYKILDELNNIYNQYQYSNEAEFEKMVIEKSNFIFGKNGIYFNLKKRIGKVKKGATIPDGYYLDLTFHDDPKLYLVEIELHSHNVYGHIGEQILRFGISSEFDKYRIKNLLLDDILVDLSKEKLIDEYLKKSKLKNVNAMLDKVIFENKPAAVIVIDEATEELINVLGQLTMVTEVIEAQTYICGKEKIHRFTPFKEEVLLDVPKGEDADDLNTIIVPAREEGFQEEFLKNNCWFAIRISPTMMEKIKYIAAYQVAPISGISFIAEVDKIEKYRDSNKYIVYFKKGTLKQINKVKLGDRKEKAPQAPRYTSYNKLIRAKSLEDIWD